MAVTFKTDAEHDKYVEAIVSEIMDPISKGDIVAENLEAQLKQAKSESKHKPADAEYAIGHVTLFGLHIESLTQRITTMIEADDRANSFFNEKSLEEMTKLESLSEKIEEMEDLYRTNALPHFGKLITVDPNVVIGEVKTEEDLERLSRMLEDHVDELTDHVTNSVLPSMTRLKGFYQPLIASLDD